MASCVQIDIWSGGRGRTCNTDHRLFAGGLCVRIKTDPGEVLGTQPEVEPCWPWIRLEHGKANLTKSKTRKGGQVT